MSRTESYQKMLMASSHFQHNVALILEAKAVEAARSTQWIVNHLGNIHFEDHDSQVKKTLEVHEQLIEVIDGLTKMEQALAKHLSVILGDSGDSEGGDSSTSDFGDMFPFGGDSR
ncbi:hypothetical protein [Paenibacillus ginsengihumi]|uniref:hypothetical protein n=1 Tax=Paenibacillus ginsengihumi TaxID=431596 RepID=UPI0003777B11|nr:hypothetical protein [Paenibacillus ginsengihumi]